MGAIKIAQRGAQNHQPSRDEIEARFRKAFGYSPWNLSARGSSPRASSSFSRGGFFTGQASFMPSPSWRGTQMHVEVEHRLPGRLAVRLIDRQALRLERIADRARHAPRAQTAAACASSSA